MHVISWYDMFEYITRWIDLLKRLRSDKLFGLPRKQCLFCLNSTPVDLPSAVTLTCGLRVVSCVVELLQFAGLEW